MPTSIRDTTDDRREYDLYEKIRAKAPGIRNELEWIIKSDKETLRLRSRAITMMATDGVQIAKKIIANKTEDRWLRGKAFNVLAELDPIDGHALFIKAIQDHLEDQEL